MSASSPDTGENKFRVEDGKLHKSEVFWRDHQPWLKEKGYILRSRYQPDWAASWLQSPGSEKPCFECEDGFRVRRHNIMDARKTDGSLVAMKCVDTSRYPDEVAIAKLFSTEPLRSNPSNYCVPIFDVLEVPGDADATIIVMPLLWDDELLVPYETIGEAVEHFRQIFEGVRFMHQNHIAHRDCKFDNIMADITALYHESPPHPWRRRHRYDFAGKPKIVSSRTDNPLKYFFIDFDLSRLYRPEDGPPLETPAWGGDKSVPEFKSEDPCDPFAVDVYCIGNYVRDFITGREGVTMSKQGFEFMDALLGDMTQDDPKQRPTMEQVVTRLTDIIKKLSNRKLRSRIAPTGERPIKGLFRSVVHWTKQLLFIARRIPATPTA